MYRYVGRQRCLIICIIMFLIFHPTVFSHSLFPEFYVHYNCKSIDRNSTLGVVTKKDIPKHNTNITFTADFIWHNDEIPYNSKSKCFRGHSYYTNSLTANDTDIDIGSDVESLLDYPNENTCYYCVCSTSGEAVGCINRDVSFCNFYRVIRDDKHVRDRYTSLMQQDRPAYFRQLSYRLRRTMDNGVFDMLDAGMLTVVIGASLGFWF